MPTSAIFERLALNAPHVATKQLIPPFLYGTAWKKDATEQLVHQALASGFTAIDTANQPKHYREDLVGDGLRRALRDGTIKRSDVFVQTKYTPFGGQDPDNLPYNPQSSITEQVRASVESSLAHFHSPRSSHSSSSPDSEAAYLDAVLLHSPLPSLAETMEAWQALEQYVPARIRHLGISNCDQFTLMDIVARASVPPAVVQNRFYAATRFDVGLRRCCAQHAIVYQSFWTLTANPQLLRAAEVCNLAARLSLSVQEALYVLVLGLGGTVILNGTTNVQRMRQDLLAVETARAFAEENPDEWAAAMSAFRKLIGEEA